jgi:hypothetical protein
MRRSRNCHATALLAQFARAARPRHTAQPVTAPLLTVKIRQPSHEFTFGVGMTFVSYSLVLTPVV